MLADRSTVNGVIADLMKADEPSVELDRAIERLMPPHSMPMRRYTSSVDDALTLVPPEWFWRVGHTTLYRAWAGCYKMHPDHTEEGRTEFNWHRDHWEHLHTTPAMALCIVALEAQRAIHCKIDR